MDQNTPNMAHAKSSAQVRPARAEDYEAVMAVNRFVYDGSDYLPVMYHMYMHNKRVDCYVVEVEGEVVGFKMHQETVDGQRLVSLAARIKPSFQKLGLSGVLNQKALSFSLRKRPGVNAVTYCTPFRSFIRQAVEDGTKLGKQVVWTWDEVIYVLDREYLDSRLPVLQQTLSGEYHCARCTRAEFMDICSDTDMMRDLFPAGIMPSGPNWYPVKSTQSRDIFKMATSHELFATRSRDGSRAPVVSYYWLHSSSTGVCAPCYTWCQSEELYKANVVTMLKYILKATRPGCNIALLLQWKDLDNTAIKNFFSQAFDASYISDRLSDIGGCAVERPVSDVVPPHAKL